jgi:flagellar operon protein
MATTNISGSPGGFKPGSLDNLQGPQPQQGKTNTPGGQSAEEFRKTLEALTGSPTGNAPVGGFQGGLQPAPLKAPPASAGLVGGLKFSNHAVERMRSRGINFAPEQMTAIENGVAKAAAKGSKDTLVITGESALIVNVKNNTVVTVMDRAGMKENVFTNIDSTVMV